MGVLAFGVKSQGNHLLCVRYQSNGEKDMNHVMSAKLTGLEIHCRNALSTAHNLVQWSSLSTVNSLVPPRIGTETAPANLFFTYILKIRFTYFTYYSLAPTVFL